MVISGGLVAADLSPATADTTSTVRGNVIKVTIKIDVFAPRNLRTGPDGTPLADYLRSVLDSTWGKAFSERIAMDCFELELDLRLAVRDINASPREGHHQLYITTGASGWLGVGWDGADETRGDSRTGDGTRSFENDRKGDLPANAPPTVVAHEFGHIMGLGDDRNKQTREAKPGRTDTLMVGGAKGVDPDKPLTIDQNLIDRIARVVSADLKNRGDELPTCERWKGPFRGTFQFPGCSTGSTHGSVSLGVVDDDVAGTLDITHDSYSCGGSAVPATSFTDVPVRGSKSRRAFNLRTQYGPGDFPMRLTIEGPRATGTFSFKTVPSSIEARLRCTEHCPDENS